MVRFLLLQLINKITRLKFILHKKIYFHLFQALVKSVYLHRLYINLLGGFCYEIICTKKRDLSYQRMPDHSGVARIARPHPVL